MTGTNQPIAACAKGVSVHYGATLVLDALDLQVPTGGVYGLLGRNGTGKSTLVRCLLGQERPSRGHLELLGLDSWRHRPALMRRVGVVPETPQVPPRANADELLAMGSRLYPIWDVDEAKRRLRRFSVPSDVSFGRLSKGQQKQVELALALAQRPELLVLDDPSLGLDSVARKVLYEELLEHLAESGVTVFLTSHDLDAVERLVETVAILHRGKLLVEEPLEDLKRRFRRISLREGEALDSAIPAVLQRTSPWGREAVVAHNLQSIPESFSHEGHAMSLEEIFEALVGTETAGGES
ncbi:MAG: ABC transporter ATP-binding protein [Thermoanaerobaculia bacterium]|nr:ABC transporter ATP-binding protein [Thermoanaerobaculia bacterium]